MLDKLEHKRRLLCTLNAGTKILHLPGNTNHFKTRRLLILLKVGGSLIISVTSYLCSEIKSHLAIYTGQLPELCRL